ncbi:hypothetical protein Tco_0603406 [Tanacetum coccineum]
MIDCLSIVETEKVIYTVKTDKVKLVVEIESFGMSSDEFDKKTRSSDGLQPKQADLSCVHALNELHLHEIHVVPNKHEADQYEREREVILERERGLDEHLERECKHKKEMHKCVKNEQPTTSPRHGEKQLAEVELFILSEMPLDDKGKEGWTDEMLEFYEARITKDGQDGNEDYKRIKFSCDVEDEVGEDLSAHADFMNKNVVSNTVDASMADMACSFMLCDLDFEPSSLSLSSMPSCDLESFTNILILCLILKASNQS